MSELRITDTNSMNDSKGRAFGLEGNDFMYVLVALVAALALYLILTAFLHVSMIGGLIFALPVLLGPLAWVLLLRHNKSAGYAEDFFDEFVNREGWSFASRAQPVFPSKEPRA
jgi:Flp pilus assembly protein TadB